MQALLTMAYAAAMVDRSILVLLIGPLQRDLHLSDTQFGLLQGVTFALFYVLAGLPIGYLIDRFPRVLIIAAGLVVWSLATAMSALAGTFAMLFLARAIVAIGEATLSPAAYSLLSNLYPRHRLGRAIGIFSTGASIGTGLAYLLGGALLSTPGAADVSLPVLGPLRIWQLAFLIAGLPGLLLALLIGWQREPARARQETAAAPSQAWRDFLRARRAPLLLIYAASCCQTLLLYVFMTWSPALLLRAHGLSGAATGLILASASVVFGLAGFIAGGLLADRWMRMGRRDAHMRVGFWAHCLILPVGLIATMARPLILVVPALCALSFLQLATGPAAIAALQLITPPELRGRVSALLLTATTIAGVGLGPTLVAVLNDNMFHSQTGVGSSMACLVALIAPLAMLVFHRARSSVGAVIAGAS